MKKLLFLLAFISLSVVSFSQSLVGSWQLMKESSCIEEDLPAVDESAQALLDDMKSMNDKTPQVLRFRDNQTGDESTHILHKSKVYNSLNFLYKFDGAMLYILDKKSHTIVNTYTVETSEADSLILSNSARPCETKIFVRIK